MSRWQPPRALSAQDLARGPLDQRYGPLGRGTLASDLTKLEDARAELMERLRDGISSRWVTDRYDVGRLAVGKFFRQLGAYQSGGVVWRLPNRERVPRANARLARAKPKTRANDAR